MNQKKPKPEHLKVIEGMGKASKRTAEPRKKPVYFLLLFLALFLLAQILFGWVWGNVNQDAINTVLAGEGFVDVSFSAAGVITYSEKVVLAPRSGFVYYQVAEGERVPVGKELARITEFPLEEEIKEENEEPGFTEYFQRIKDWFLGEKNEDFSCFFPANEEVKVVAPLPGLVDFGMDGFEKFGPDSYFPYLTPEEFEEKAPDEQILCSGEKVLRSTPLLKLINNYYWYFSTVLPLEHGRLVAESLQDKLFFSFAPDIPVWGRKVESRERDDGRLEITWCIDRELPGLYDHRWDSAEIVYKNLEGVLIPKSALLEIDDKKGVYIIEKGLVTFREIVILTERENDFLVKNLELYERVITRPDSVKEGQRFYW
jgi:putative membrane fusion protein